MAGESNYIHLPQQRSSIVSSLPQPPRLSMDLVFCYPSLDELFEVGNRVLIPAAHSERENQFPRRPLLHVGLQFMASTPPRKSSFLRLLAGCHMVMVDHQ